MADPRKFRGVDVPGPDERKPIDEYTGRDRYIDWIRDYLGVELTEPQKEIIYTVQDNQRTLVVAGNGFGKSFALACFSLAYLFVNYPTSVLATSGTYAKLRRTYCRPIQDLHESSWGLPGRYLRSNPPRIVIDGEPQVFWEAASPGDPGELEGVHNEYTLGVIEEADKSGVTPEIFDSLGSMLTDENDKLIAVANPPQDETNVVYDLMDDPTWRVCQYSSFDSHNVQIEINHPDPYEKDEDGDIATNSEGFPKVKDEVKQQFIPEVVTLNQIKSDWLAWNVEPWPGVEEAMRSDEREDLDVRWYRRRMGVISPQAAEVLRPFTVEDVENAFRAEPARITETPDGIGWDVVRGGGTGGDYNALSGVFGRDLRIFDWWRGDDSHLDNYETIRSEVESAWNAPFAIDSVGVGSEAPDRVDVFYSGDVIRFNAGSTAADATKYTDRWTEGLCVLGEYLRDGGGFQNERLREELLTAARVVELREKYSSKHDSTRYWATRKSAVKNRLGRSPDLLDSMYMACLMAETGGGSRRKIPSSF